jgi:pimeloyl-ACP methyl ester carboxylesterase
MKRILKISGVVLIIIVIAAGVMIYSLGPTLPEDTDETIDAVMQSELPELLQGETGYVQSRETKIWYEAISPDGPPKGTILLFIGISADALGWPQSFLDALVAEGYQVIRFDYRGTGMSDWVEDWEQNPYSLTDLAADAAAILDSVGVEQAHLIGVSMGGMVAQQFAIDHPDRTLTLTSMMSSGNINDPELPPISQKMAFDLIKIGIKYGIFPTERNTIKLNLAARTMLRGDADYNIDVRETAEQVLYNLRQRNGYNPGASQQHQEAVIRSGSRYYELQTLEIPTLVIHGMNDPFIPIEHSKKLASIIPDSKTKWFENMGHDLPPYLIDDIVAELIQNFERNPGE